MKLLSAKNLNMLGEIGIFCKTACFICLTSFQTYSERSWEACSLKSKRLRLICVIFFFLTNKVYGFGDWDCFKCHGILALLQCYKLYLI